jgi:hypothetical protein
MVIVLVVVWGCRPAPDAAKGVAGTEAENVARIHGLLGKDCGTSDADSVQVVTQLGKIGSDAYPILWDALRHGPSAAERQGVGDRARMEHAQIARFLKSGGLGGEGLERLREGARRLSEQDYVALQVDGFVIGFQERALGALVLLKAPAARDSLGSIARDPRVPPAVRTRIEAELKKL